MVIEEVVFSGPSAELIGHMRNINLAEAHNAITENMRANSSPI